MNLSIYQIAVPLFALLMVLSAVSRLRRGEQSGREFFAWFTIWAAIAAAAFFPQWTSWLARITGIRSNINAIVFTSLAVIFYFLFKIILKQEQIEQDLTKIVRHEALAAVSRKQSAISRTQKRK